MRVQIFVEMRPDSSEEFFAFFICAEQMRDNLTTPLPVMTTPLMRTEETTLNCKAKKQACTTTV